MADVKDIAEMTNDELMLDYISELRFHIGNSDYATAAVIVDVLEEFITDNILDPMDDEEDEDYIADTGWTTGFDDIEDYMSDVW